MAALTSRSNSVEQLPQVHSRSFKVSSLLMVPQQEQVFDDGFSVLKLVHNVEKHYLCNMEKDISGIYKIRNTINHKVYIGSAVCCMSRFRLHKSDLNKGRHNKRFQNFVNKYGFETLIFEVIEIVKDKENLIEREQYWIDYYQSYKSKFGFNIAKIAGSTLGCKMPESHKESCRNRMLGNKYSLGRKWTKEEKEDIGERSKEMWKNNPEKLKNAIIKSLQKRKGKPQWVDKPHPLLGKEHPAKGQKRSEEFCELMRKQRLENNGMRGVKLSQERKEQISKLHSKPVNLIDTNGNILQNFSSQKEATINLCLTKGAVSRVCNGEYKQTKGYIFQWG